MYGLQQMTSFVGAGCNGEIGLWLQYGRVGDRLAILDVEVFV